MPIISYFLNNSLFFYFYFFREINLYAKLYIDYFKIHNFTKNISSFPRDTQHVTCVSTATTTSTEDSSSSASRQLAAAAKPCSRLSCQLMLKKEASLHPPSLYSILYLRMSYYFQKEREKLWQRKPTFDEGKLMTSKARWWIVFWHKMAFYYVKILMCFWAYLDFSCRRLRLKHFLGWRRLLIMHCKNWPLKRQLWSRWYLPSETLKK